MLAWRAGEEAVATVVLVALTLVLAGLTFRNRKTRPYRLSALLEIGMLVGAIVLIHLHCSGSFGRAFRGWERTYVSQRVPGPILAWAAAFVMLLGSGLKLIHTLTGRSR